MAESILKIGQVESVITFDKTNAETTEILESLMGEDWDTEGMTAKERLHQVHLRMWESVMRDVEVQRSQRIRREMRQKHREELARIQDETRLVKREEKVARRATTLSGEDNK